MRHRNRRCIVKEADLIEVILKDVRSSDRVRTYKIPEGVQIEITLKDKRYNITYRIDQELFNKIKKDL